jgi:hypothetical protein
MTGGRAAGESDEPNTPTIEYYRATASGRSHMTFNFLRGAFYRGWVPRSFTCRQD